MTMSKSKWWLAGVWLSGAAVVFAILVTQSLVGRYGSHADEAWAWYLPTVMPTLSLIVGTLVVDSRNPAAAGDATAPGGLLWLALGLSVFYLLLVAVSVLVQPLLQQMDPIELMHRSNLWLGPLQGLTVGALAAFFRTR